MKENWQALEKQAQELMNRAKEQKMAERSGVIERIRKLIATYDIKLRELAVAAPGKPKGGEPKYRDPKTGKTWTGTGKAPSWMPAKGPKRDAFLIAKQIGPQEAAGPAKFELLPELDGTETRRARETPGKAHAVKKEKTAKQVRSKVPAKKVPVKSATGGKQKPKRTKARRR